MLILVIDGGQAEAQLALIHILCVLLAVQGNNKEILRSGYLCRGWLMRQHHLRSLNHCCIPYNEC